MPARASHPSLATSHPRGWPRPRLAPRDGALSCPHFRARPPLVTPRPRLRLSARPAHPAIKASARPNPRTPTPRRRRRRCIFPPSTHLLLFFFFLACRSTNTDGRHGRHHLLLLLLRRQQAQEDHPEAPVRPPPVPRRRPEAAVGASTCECLGIHALLLGCALNELDLNTAALDPEQYAARLRVILQKELRNSDVSQLGRIVLPKKEAEAYLPNLISKDGKTDENYEIFDGILNSLPEIVANVRYSDFFDPFGDCCMDMANPLNASHSVNLATHFHDEKTGNRLSQPKVIVVPRAKDDDCLILATDGMWDVISNEEACRVARLQILLWHKRNDCVEDDETGDEPTAAVNDPAAQAAADYLVKLALRIGSTDNITSP
ncbi:hypothetical protein PR202_gb04992 [Eleusine coracana subsp. coracana]|uniref:protein-serine/threonine phosphatase n=1 Tax=Eleusine coracana subsp. coracana TaxID=191504 RepID=A0AAV5E5S6_ELECO|nr:hypothetical protein PR202_gb04992 [Eleusine coracana subsp. coracana]